MLSGRCYQFGSFRLDGDGCMLFREGKRVALTPKVLELLIVLVEAHGNPVTKEALLQRVWAGIVVEEGSLTSHISILRKVLGDGINGGQFIETLPKRGYRFRALVTEDVKSQAAPTAQKFMLAVLPFESFSRDKKQEYFSDGLTEEMITQLGRLNPERLGVIARTSAMQYKGTDKTIQEIGRELAVSYVLEGSVRRAANRVRIAAQLIQVSDQTHLWAETYDRDLGNILVIQNEVARAIAMQIKIKLTPREQTRLAYAEPVNLDAYEAYLKGRYFWNRRTLKDLRKSIQHFERAIQHDPAYAPAYAGLADSYLTLQDEGHLPRHTGTAKAKTAAARALRIDETLAEAHNSLAHAHFHELNWLAAEHEFKRSLDLNPNYATAHFYYANYLIAMGRLEEAVTEARRAQSLDPMSLAVQDNVARSYYYAGQYAQATVHALKVFEIEPAFSHTYESLGRIYEQQGRYEEAITAFRKAVSSSARNPGYLASLAHACALAGRKRESLQLLEELRRKSKTGYVTPYAFALVSLALGRKSEALACLKKACQQRASEVPFLKVNPRLASLHSEPEFQKILRRLGLKP